MKKTIPIFFAIDSGYVPYLSIAVASLIDNASKRYNYNIHVIYESIRNDDKKKLKTLETDNAHIIFNKMKDGLEKITKRKENYLRADIFTLTIYYRIFLPYMFPEYDKAIYLDSDTCIVGDISLLYNIDLKDNLFGGCNDISCQYNKILCNYFKENAGITVDKYINSGVLLMNMKKLRDVDFENHFLNLLTSYHFDSVCPDQDYINVMANGKILHLSNEWDAMPTGGKLVFKNPKIVHYNLFLKPWRYDGVDYEEYFWKYVDTSLYKDEIYYEKETYTQKQKDEDQKHMQLLVKRADEISKSDTTFKKLEEKGVQLRIKD